MIEVRHITLRYDRFTALENLSMTVGRASVYGLIGVNGAGKTTLLKTIAGLFQPQKGTVRIAGEAVFDNSKIRQNLFFLSDDFYYFPNATLADMAAFYRGFYPRWSDALYRKLVAAFDLEEKSRIRNLSKGMQRQAQIILALTTRPLFLLLDEIFDGLDPAMRQIARRLILDMIAATETAVVLSSHHLRELEDLCDRIGFLGNRRIVLENDIDAVRRRRTRYRIVLDRAVTAHDLAAVRLKNFMCSGRTATFVAIEDSDAVDEKLALLSPVLVEKIPLTLEELFLDEVEAKQHDFSTLYEDKSRF